MPGTAQKLLVGVLMGGQSAEHEISLKTGEEALRNLDRAKYCLRPIFISKTSQWFVGKKRVEPKDALSHIDVVFNAMHGEYGEDGQVQSLLNFYNIPYTGSGVIASALAMDKYMSRKIFKAHKLAVPRTICITQKDLFSPDKLYPQLFIVCGSPPWVVKPRSCGSSVGVSIIKRRSGFKKSLNEAFKFDRSVLIEEYLPGVELTVPILEKKSGQPEALPAVEIRPRKSEFFDYHEKYSGSAGAEEIVPARISPGLAAKVSAAALKAHTLLGCVNYSRVDCIVAKGEPHILEVNTLPGFTAVSLFPKSAKSAGLDFSELLDTIIGNALRKGEEHDYTERAV